MDKKSINKITQYIFISQPIKKSDLLFVFGTRFNKPVKIAAELLKNGYAKYILFSGGVNKTTGKNEARRMQKKAIELGVARENIIIEDKSTNTLENILFGREIINQKTGLKNIRTITLICKNYHARRALMTFKKHFPRNIELRVYPYEIYGFTRDNWHRKKIGLEKVLEEMERIKKYLNKGDLEQL